MSKVKEITDFVWEKLQIDRRLSSENRVKILSGVRVVLFASWFITTIAGAYLGYYANQYLTELNKKPDFYASIGPLDKDSSGYFMPLSLTNTGTKDVMEAIVSFSTCYSDVPTLTPQRMTLISGKNEIVKIRDKNLMSRLNSKPGSVNNFAETPNV